ncbi:MAG: PAS domain S-box protein [Reyranellaceae bacterium]
MSSHESLRPQSGGQLSAESDSERFRLLVEAVVDYAIYMLDPQGLVVSWNTGARRFKGYEADEVMGRHFSLFYTDEDRRAGVPETALQTAASAGKYEAEGWRIRKDGSRYWAHVVIDPIRSPQGELLGYAKITRDLTERRKAAEALADTQEEFRLLVQSVTDYAIFMLDLEGRVATWNAGARRIKGYEPEEIIGRHFSAFYAEEDRDAGLPARVLSTAAREGRFEHEGWRLRKDGSRFWAHVVVDPIRGADGHIRGFAKITRDITERRDAQIKLEQAREALFQSQKLESIGKLTGGIAHDFNNLLAAILGSLELVRKRVDGDPRIDRLLRNAMQAAERGATLTQRMLAFARRQELRPEPVDLWALVSGMAELLRRSLGPGIDLATRFPARLRRIVVDPNQLEMAILNLAVNARDAMPDGGAITLSAREESITAGNGLGLAPGAYVVLAVADHGTGMDEETLRSATEPFFTTKGPGKGTGLGLSMVLGLVEQSGGRLQMRSRPGEGTTASLWFPAEDRPAAAATLPDERTSPASTGRALTILVVDDDALVLLNTAAMLEDLGHHVTTASSGSDALRLLAAPGAACDLLVTDHGMPGMSGLQLMAEARALRPGLPAILATGYAEVPSGDPRDYVRVDKPFFQKQLADAVETAVGQAREP